MKISLLWKYLKYDVDQLVNRYAGVRLAESPEKRDSADLSGGNASDTALIRRLVITGAARLHSALGDAVVNTESNADDKLTEVASWDYQFNSNEEYDGKSMASLMHWFVVRFVMWQWLKTYGYTSEANGEYADLKDVEKELKRKVADGAMPVKAPCYRLDMCDDGVDLVYTDEVEIVYNN